MQDRYQGDPKMILTANGSNLVSRGGQPVMDQGLENAIFISLFTALGWYGNFLFKKPAEKIGSRYEESNAQSITVSSLNENRMAAEAALKWMAEAKIFKTVNVRVTNPTANAKKIFILVSPPVTVMEISKNGVNWQMQYLDPAHLRI